ncbi:helix-turn-helix domain-containing protein [Deinococcus sp. KSM4-11]|uniref:helix-turn-helix domain-containing protein n=1 Tax=Deinococcus sp. KSM4-11 TaxID=2568654 RepID=UPI0010A3C654|nr:helix-turn-helix domain-containing protein [Deinococcus sp. KSM4-11]THF88429.1 helix-turn-helix domain-containing protein [Deinococcus sp. KSM4-11]
MKPYMSVPEVAELLGCNVKTIYAEIEHGRLQCVRLGRIIRVPAAALTAWETAQTGSTSTVSFPAPKSA